MRPIEIPEFSFTSDLAQAVFDLERLRGDLAAPTTPPVMFLQLKSLFQFLTSIMSARIEGNRTTILEAVIGTQSEGTRGGPQDHVREIAQLQEASDFIDRHMEPGAKITHALIRELHRIAVDGLTREGDKTPGSYRTTEVGIQGSGHTPPLAATIQSEMSDLVDFINETEPRNLDLLRTAIAHHRFLWIHPFGNGNGRVARLLTYAMLVRQNFTSTTVYRALNPTSVFGADRQLYYERLADADSLEQQAMLRWCSYMLNGLRDDLNKTYQLGKQDFVIEKLLLPAITRCRLSGGLTTTEAHALSTVAKYGEVKAGNLTSAFPGSATTRSKAVRHLLEERFLEPIEPGKRTYRLVLAPGPLTTYLVRQLDQLEFLPAILRENIDR